MRTSFFTVLMVVVLLVPKHQAAAQSPEMPEPLAIVVDADGKPMAQVIDIEDFQIRVLFSFDGVPARSSLNPYFGHFSGGGILYFSEDNCSGNAYLEFDSTINYLDFLNQQVFRIAGPDAVSGTYRVFRSTSMETSQVSVESGWEDYPPYSGACNDIPATTHDLLPAEEILPNPLEGFHGPTVANPERLCRVKGGTRLP